MTRQAPVGMEIRFKAIHENDPGPAGEQGEATDERRRLGSQISPRAMGRVRLDIGLSVFARPLRGIIGRAIPNIAGRFRFIIDLDVSQNGLHCGPATPDHSRRGSDPSWLVSFGNRADRLSSAASRAAAASRVRT